MDNQEYRPISELITNMTNYENGTQLERKFATWIKNLDIRLPNQGYDISEKISESKSKPNTHQFEILLRSKSNDGISIVHG